MTHTTRGAAVARAAAPPPSLGDLVMVGDERWRIADAHPFTLELRSWEGRQAIVSRSWLEAEPDQAGFRRSWRAHRCIPTR